MSLWCPRLSRTIQKWIKLRFIKPQQLSHKGINRKKQFSKSLLLYSVWPLCLDSPDFLLRLLKTVIFLTALPQPCPTGGRKPLRKSRNCCGKRTWPNRFKPELLGCSAFWTRHWIFACLIFPVTDIPDTQMNPTNWKVTWASSYKLQSFRDRGQFGYIWRGWLKRYLVLRFLPSLHWIRFISSLDKNLNQLFLGFVFCKQTFQDCQLVTITNYC